MTNWEELKWRGLVKDVSNEEEIAKLINAGGVTFYWGTDPTADSLHIGHYSSLVTAKRLMKMGHNPILLCGGATGRIGDPRPTAEREIINIDVLNHNIDCIRKQIDTIFDGKAKLVNNYDWFQGYEFVDFLRDVGKYINVNYMLDKDIIKRRLETGITFAEFSYTLMQGYDFVKMYQDMGCIMQVEGSDQWGNITTGIELAKRMLDKELYAFTMPLILDANGNKFGKSEGNALWIDKNKTSSYALYQYLINTDDTKVEEYLKVFTFLTREEIESLMLEHNKEPHLRKAQKMLAKCFVSDLHGIDEANKAEMMSEALFTEDINKLTSEDILNNFTDMEQVKLEDNMILEDLLVSGGICSSKREARELVNGNAISLNNKKINDSTYLVTRDQAIDNKIYLIKKGKKKYYLGIYE